MVRIGWFKRLFVLLVLIRSGLTISAQTGLCEGNLGDNIFTSGDFGSGAANVVQTNPGLAPGFLYTTQVPPDDGEYTLTNDMRQWSFVFPAWMQIGDNDVDPNGYMMVVNASFSPGIFYEQLIDDLCENTLYQFSADVINIVQTPVQNHILPNVSFLIDGVVLYSTGSMPQDELWHTYGFTFITGPGQFSAKLTLRNNAPGGIGNDLALDNISFQACGPSSSISIEPEGRICENTLFPILSAHVDADTGAFQWQVSIDSPFVWSDIPGATDRMYQVQQVSAGDYYFRYLYSNSISSIDNPRCRIVSDIIHVEIVPVEFLIRDTLCERMTFNLGGVEYDSTGIYQVLLTASNGCDSIVTLDLLVVPDPPIIADFGTNPTSCEGATDGSVFVASVSGTRPPYIFFINDSLIPPPNTLVHLPAGTYTARIENEYGCFAEEVVVVEDGPPLDVTTIEDTTILLGHSLLLTSITTIPASMASWTPVENVGCPICFDTYVTPLADQTYVIEAFTDEGCTDKDSVHIRVDRTPVLYIPNIFSPDGDQINDYFSISTDPLNIKTIDEVFIFDRWGGVISHQADLISDHTLILWDGDTDYGPALPGTYVYMIRFTMADDSERTVSGDVTVLR